MISYVLSGLLPIAAGFAIVQLRRKRFGPTWTASSVIRSGECMVRLVAGPFEERTICLLGVPAIGAMLQVENPDQVRTLGLQSLEAQTGYESRRGHYEVVAVGPDGRHGVAAWWLDT